MHVHRGERDIRTDSADVRDMVVNPLEFQANRTKKTRPHRRLDPRRSLHCVTKSRGMGKTRVPRNALCQPHRVRQCHIFKELFGSLVHVKHSQLQIENRLPRDAEQEMSRLDNTRMHRSHWDLKYTLSFHGTELM